MDILASSLNESERVGHGNHYNLECVGKRCSLTNSFNVRVHCVQTVSKTLEKNLDKNMVITHGNTFSKHVSLV